MTVGGLQVLQIMCENVVHRVYVCEKGASPYEVVGVVTPTDILALVAGVGPWGAGKGASNKRGTGEGEEKRVSAAQDPNKKPKIGTQQEQEAPQQARSCSNTVDDKQ